MNIRESKQIPIRDVIEHYGARHYRQTRPHINWYYSPFRDERTASLKTDDDDNTWIDFGHLMKKGDAVDFVCDMHNWDRNDGKAISKALKELDMFDNIPRIHLNNQFQQAKRDMTYENRFRLKRRMRITHPNCLDEIGRRTLSLDLVSQYVQQAELFDTKTKRTGYGFAFENDAQGYEVSIPVPKTHDTFKTCIGKKDITTFRAHPKYEYVTVMAFSGFWDFLTYLRLNGDKRLPDHDYVIYNSDALIGRVAEYVKQRKPKQLLHAFDNDESGQQADWDLADALTELPLNYGTLNRSYYPYKDLSAWRQNYPGGLFRHNASPDLGNSAPLPGLNRPTLNP